MATKSGAANLATLFDEVLIPPADEYLPDYQLYTSGDVYFNPDLRIRVDLNWAEMTDLSEIAKELLTDDQVSRTLKNHGMLPDGEWQARHVIARTLSQIRLALENDAVFIAGDGVAAFVKDLWKFVGDRLGVPDGDQTPPNPMILSTETLNLVGLDWACSDVGSLAAVRQSKQIDQYGTNFRKILRTSSSATVRADLLAAMRKAMDYEEIAKMARKGFETTGVASTAAGVIPGVGTPAALVGLKSFLAGKEAERQAETHRWYLLGAKLREVSLQNLLTE